MKDYLVDLTVSGDPEANDLAARLVEALEDAGVATGGISCDTGSMIVHLLVEAPDPASAAKAGDEATYRAWLAAGAEGDFAVERLAIEPARDHQNAPLGRHAPPLYARR